MKVYITKYALTQGIEEAEVERVKHDPRYVCSTTGWRMQYVLGKDAFQTMEEAVDAAYDMRDKKLESLRKSIDRLEKLTFDQ